MDEIEAGLSYALPTVAKAKFHLLRNHRPVCNPASWSLPSSICDARKIKVEHRCRRKGCVKAWARFDAARSAGRLATFQV